MSDVPTWVLAVAAAVIGLSASGCASPAPRSLRTELTPIHDQRQVASLVKSLCDELMFSTSTSCAAVIARTDRTDAKEFCAAFRLATGMGAVGAATAPNAGVGLADVLTLVTLQRTALEEDAARAALDERDRRFLHEVLTRDEQELWRHAGRVLSSAEQDELRAMIIEWRQRFPERRALAYARLQDFAAERQVLQTDSAKHAAPLSILRLLSLDPTVGLDSATRQIYESRELAERVTYWGQRLPTLLSWQLELTAARLLAGPEVRQALASTTQMAGAAESITRTADRVADTYKKMLDDLPRERQAAVEQVGRESAGVAQAAIKQFAAESTTALRDAIDRLGREADGQRERAVVDVAHLLATERRQTLEDAEMTAARLIDRASTRLALALIAAAVAIAVLVLFYQWSTRMIRGRS